MSMGLQCMALSLVPQCRGGAFMANVFEDHNKFAPPNKADSRIAHHLRRQFAGRRRDI
ncbi:hypothetical protein GRI44_13545 [Altererythrobacter confluentis]|uniref:Uncharacterized protein n=1 Tax=Allopontixanthobacter confluentis TaxID=1849021 RepID=A0A6L7GKE3_9SPHN|nr:hypothetical protein [Allopontixanthobacter confluentis]MXP15774.1 hypothetical protein [Allopontixanthobacter confluentis]